jgi:hypothetical protein
MYLTKCFTFNKNCRNVTEKKTGEVWINVKSKHIRTTPVDVKKKYV